LPCHDEAGQRIFAAVGEIGKSNRTSFHGKILSSFHEGFDNHLAC
jgi:hypothetical protein